jgi:Uncharacterized protein conserved in bacteria
VATLTRAKYIWLFSMKKPYTYILLVFTILFSQHSFTQVRISDSVNVGAVQMSEYLPLLKNKRVALLVNQTSVVGNTHLVDTLLKRNIRIVRIFAPEHGFRGTAEAGEKVKNGVDIKSGLPITSMYGANKKPTKASMKGIDIVIFDIQDVGVRFYTYISSLQYMMEACAEANIPLILLDRPNPNGFYVDGPVLKPAFKSFVGMQPIPVVHGMTVGEYAQMLNGEKWLQGGKRCKLQVISCENYTHNTLCDINIPPSPNLKNLNAIYLYPSLCFFEGTNVSVGRGTNHPFEQWGHPDFKGMKHSFVPQPTEGAKNPLQVGKKCYGEDLRNDPLKTFVKLNKKINLNYLITAYNQTKSKDTFFNSFFDKLAGTDTLKKQIIAGLSEEEIRKTWSHEIQQFKKIRNKYLLYPDFE